MAQAPRDPPARADVLSVLARKNVLAGGLFIAIAALGLWLARDYPVGTVLRMGTGYMPKLLCWVLMGLGAIVLAQGLVLPTAPPHAPDSPGARPAERDRVLPIVLVASSLVAFGLSIERLGLIVAIALLVGIASLAYRGLRWWEVVAAAIVLGLMSWLVFVVGLGMSVPVLPALPVLATAER